MYGATVVDVEVVAEGGGVVANWRWRGGAWIGRWSSGGVSIGRWRGGTGCGGMAAPG